MTNPTSTHLPPTAQGDPQRRNGARRRNAGRIVPVVAGLAAFGLLGVAAAANGQFAAIVLAAWVGLLIAVGLRLSSPSSKPAAATPARRSQPTVRRPTLPALSSRIQRRPVLMLAEMNEHGELGATRTLAVVASPAAIAVIDSRPTG